MKKQIYLFLTALAVVVSFNSCSDDDDATPEEVNEEEVITTLIATLTPDGGGTPITLTSRDLDGEDGPNAPDIIVSASLAANTTYSGTVSFLNEQESPAENITEEVEEEDDEHQVFFVPASGLNITTEYTNFDGDGNPLGTTYNLTTGDASTGNFTITLRHEPSKPNTGLADAGGETDIQVTFPITVE